MRCKEKGWCYVWMEERQMKRCRSKTKAFDYLSSWICTEIWRKSFPLPDSFQNGICCSVLNFSCVFQRLEKSAKWIRGDFKHSKFSPEGLLERSSFMSDSYKIFVKRFHFCVSWSYLRLPFLIKSNRNEECHVIYFTTTMSKISVYCSSQNNTCIISSLSSLKVVRPVQSLSTFAWFCLKEIISTLCHLQFFRTRLSLVWTGSLGPTVTGWVLRIEQLSLNLQFCDYALRSN